MVNVSSSKEPAYDPVLSIELPKHLPLSFLPSNCFARDLSADDRLVVDCNLPSPLNRGEDVRYAAPVILLRCILDAKSRRQEHFES
jgi:hypothetical protein